MMASEGTVWIVCVNEATYLQRIDVVPVSIRKVDMMAMGLCFWCIDWVKILGALVAMIGYVVFVEL